MNSTHWNRPSAVPERCRRMNCINPQIAIFKMHTLKFLLNALFWNVCWMFFTVWFVRFFFLRFISLFFKISQIDNKHKSFVSKYLAHFPAAVWLKSQLVELTVLHCLPVDQICQLILFTVQRKLIAARLMQTVNLHWHVF